MPLPLPRDPLSPRQPMTPLTPLVPMKPLQPLQPIGAQRAASSATVEEQPAADVPSAPRTSQQWAPPQTYQQMPAPQVPPRPILVPGGFGQLPGQLPGRVRSRNTAAGIAVAVGVLVVLLAAIGSRTSHGGQPVVVSVPSISIGQIAPTQEGSTTGRTPQPIASLGQARTLSGTIDGETVRVTLIRWVDNAKASDSFFAPGRGKRFVAAQFRVTDIGSVGYVDAPANGASVIDASGRKYRPAFLNGIRQGAVFEGAVSVQPGQSADGFLVFEVPKHATIRKVRFSENSGFGQTGEWSIKR